MRKDDTIRLRHMIDAAEEAISFTSGRKREDLDSDRMLALSLVKEIEIVGEAASKVSEACRARYPEIPWPSIITMRHRLIHGYFDINLDVVWATVTDELAPPVTSLKKALAID